MESLREQLVLHEARALELGLAARSPHLLEELRYELRDLNVLRAKLAQSTSTDASELQHRAGSVYAEICGLVTKYTAKYRNPTCPHCKAA